MIFEVDLTDIEIASLEKEYNLLGLGQELPGNRPTPMARVVKKLVEAIRKARK